MTIVGQSIQHTLLMFRAGPFDLLCSYTQNTLVNKQTLRCEWIYSSSQSYFGQVEQLTIMLLSFIDNNSIYSNDASIGIWNVSWWWFMEMGAWARVQFMGYVQSSPKEAPGHAKNTLFPGKKKKLILLRWPSFLAKQQGSWLELPGGALCVPTKLHSCQELV